MPEKISSFSPSFLLRNFIFERFWLLKSRSKGWIIQPWRGVVHNRNSPACNLARDCNLGPEIAIWEPQPQPVCPCSSHTIPSSTSFSLKYLRKVLSFPSHLCSKECVSLKLTPPYGQTPTDEVKISKSQIAISAKFESEIAISAKLQSLV